MSTFASQLYNPSLDIVMLLIAVCIEIVLALAVFLSDRKSATNKIFSLLTIFTILWLLITHIVRAPGLLYDSLTLHRLGIFFAAPMSSLFLLLAHTIPSKKIEMPNKLLYLIFGLTVLMMLVDVSPYAFVGITIIGDTSRPTPGLGLIPFAIISTLFSASAVYVLIHKYRHADGIVKKQLRLVLLGMGAMLGLIITTILIPIIVFGSVIFLPFTPLYALVFLGVTAYAISKYQLFSIKVLLTQSLTLIMIVILFAKLFGEDSQKSQTVDLIVLLFMLMFGYFLVESVKREVKQREHIETLAKELENANTHLKELDRQKTEFVSIASHQLRSPLTAIKGYSSLILEGSFGSIPKKAQEAVEKIFTSSQFMASSIEDFLNVSRIELGTIKYDLKEFDIDTMVSEVVSELTPAAAEKKLTLSFSGHCDGPCVIKGDIGKLRQVILNLVDNSMKYTPKGSVAVSVTSNSQTHTARVEVKDTGVGIPPAVIHTLFAKFVRAANANEVNVMGTGLGLYVAKQFVEAHGGKIWAESPGQNQGSTFIVELPLLNKTETPLAQK